MKKIILNVEGMSCGHCVRAVEDALGELNGVASVSVDLEGKTAAIDYDPDQVSFEDFKAAIEEEGFDVAEKI
jgi:copper ion binding protein